MGRSNQWLTQSNSLIYVVLQSIVLFYAVKFVATRMYFDFIPEVSVLWMVVTGIALSLPLTILSVTQRKIWLLIGAVVGSVAGILLLGYSFFVIILTGGLAWFIYRKGIKPIHNVDFMNLFFAAIFWFGLAVILTFPFDYGDVEIGGLIRFFMLSLLLTVLGSTISKLYHAKNHSNKQDFWRQWGISSGQLWGGTAILALLSLVPAYIIGVIFSMFRVVLFWMLSPFSWLVKSVPILREEIYKMLMKNRKPVEGDEDNQFLTVTKQALKQIREIFVNINFKIISYIGIALAIALIFYFLYLVFRKSDREHKRYPSHNAKTSLSVDSSEDKSFVESSFWQRAKEFFLPYSGKEEHPIRKEYRHLLKIMRERGLWKNDSMTVHQMNEVFQQLKGSSNIYEKLRYGDQGLSAEEEQMFKHDLHLAVLQLKKIKKEKGD